MFQPSQPSPILPPVYGQKGFVPSPIDWYGRTCTTCWHSDNYFAPKDAKPDELKLIQKQVSPNKYEWRLHSICPKCHRWANYRTVHSSIDDPYFPLGLRKKPKSWWREFREMLFHSQPQHIAEFIYRENRRKIYEERTDYIWERQFEPFEVGKLCDMLREIERDFDCVDNERVADKSKKRQRKRFWKQAEQGCCGSHYEEVEFGGKTYMVGFNYGH